MRDKIRKFKCDQFFQTNQIKYQNMQNIQSLISQVGVIVKKNNEILDATGGRFNMFNVIGLASDEVRLHSAILAELLNPNGTHGMKDEFLKEFLIQINELVFESNRTKVYVEKSIGTVTETEGGRIDIILEDINGFAIIIENKIYASDQKAQLIRYDSYGNTQHFGKFTILYLTLFGHEASPDSAEGVKYKKISYETHILNWLEKCLSIAVRQQSLRETIFQYISLIKQLTGKDMNKITENELVDTISKSENIESAIRISQNLDRAKKKIVSNMAAAIAKKNNLEYTIYGESGLGIIFYKKEWIKNAGIWFAGYEGRTYYSIKTPEAVIGKAKYKEKKIELFKENNPPSINNPYGFGYVIELDGHWESKTELLIKIADPNDLFVENIINQYLINVLEFINLNKEIESELLK